MRNTNSKHKKNWPKKYILEAGGGGEKNEAEKLKPTKGQIKGLYQVYVSNSTFG